MARNQTPEQLLQRGLRSIQAQIAALEKIQKKAEVCAHCGLGAGLSPEQIRLLIQLVELARKSAADQYDPRRTLQKLSEAELERLARTERVPSKTND